MFTVRSVIVRANLRVEREHSPRGPAIVRGAAMRARHDARRSGNGGKDERIVERQSRGEPRGGYRFIGFGSSRERPGNVLVCDPHR